MWHNKFLLGRRIITWVLNAHLSLRNPDCSPDSSCPASLSSSSRGRAAPIGIGTYGTYGSLKNGPFLPWLGKEYGSITQFAGRLPGHRLGNRRGPLGAGFAHRALALRGSVDLVSPQGIRPCDHPGGHRPPDPRLRGSSPRDHEMDHDLVVRHPGGPDRNLCDHPRFTVARVPSGPPAGDLLPGGAPRVQRHSAREGAAKRLGLPIVRG